jgi:hypothetical protein
VGNGHHVEQRGRDRQACEADEYDSDHGIADEGHVTPESGHYIFAVHHCLILMTRMQDNA